MRQCLTILTAVAFLAAAMVGCEEGERTLFTTGSVRVSADAPASTAGPLTPANLRCEYRVDPLGIDVMQPRFSWIVQSSRRAQRQSAYRVLVAGSPEKLEKNEGDLWDSGKVVGRATSQVVYAGQPLQPQMRCHWKVMVWDTDDHPSGWSTPALWTMGLLQADQWKAAWVGLKSADAKQEVSILKDSQWIWVSEGDPAKSAPVGKRYFRATVTIPAGRKVQKGMLTMSADNGFVAYVNGREAGRGSNFKAAETMEIGEHLVEGTNVIAVVAENVGDAPNPAGLIGMARIEFEQDAPVTTFTGPDWKASEKQEAGWNEPGFDDSTWRQAKTLGPVGMQPWGQVATRIMHLPPPRFLRKGFDLSGPVRRATVYATALGIYELHINGEKVGDEYFSPGWTDYDKRVYYNTYDVTQMLRQGDNAMGAILADGWYVGYIGWGHQREHYGSDTPWVKAQLHVEYADGTQAVIATDGTWKAATGPILEADFLMGETWDANKELPGWSRGGFDDSAWSPVVVNAQIATPVQSYPGVPVTAFQEIKPLKITEPAPGRFVFDMGTNFAGFVRLKVQGEQGDKVVIRFAERLNPDGTIYTTNLRGARTMDTYICKGTGVETWQPRFTFHGFQYVELTGYPGKPGKDAVTGVELTSATPVVGAFECSDAQANQLYKNITQTQRANFIEIPTDCPQRDERLGWTGDAQIYVRTATYNTDVSAFFTKWLVDLEDAQLPNGAFPDVAPRKVAMDGGVAAWGDAGVICPWTIYQVYGDIRVLDTHYDAMTRWIDYCKGTTKDLLRPATGYGDWLSINADTPKDVLATAYFAYSTKLMAQIAEVLGKTDDAAKYDKLFTEIKAAFNKAYVDADGRIKGDTQTVYVLALAFDLLDTRDRLRAQEYLVDNIKERDYHLSTGFVGTKDLMATLTAIGRPDVAYRLFANDTFPSWGFSIKHGATSIWERWDGWTPEKGFQDPGMNSFAHYSFGAVAEWMFKTIGGIDTDGPGYRSIIIRPRPGGGLTWAKVRYDSINGPIANDWQLKWDNLYMDVTIPANTIARVYVPASDVDSITEGGIPAHRAIGVEFLRMEHGAAVYRVGSGHYRFVSRNVSTIPAAK
ncbi:MAG: family 78 glycoside hydrolase catalytic domain [Phycisphaerae bacterium]|nr:family 78 glycoside hydrolase catalytic domain [Phycisphaerae bacterium]